MSIGGTIRLLVSKYHPPLASPFLGPNPVFEIKPQGLGLRGEPVDRALRRLKKKVDRENTLRDVRMKRHYEKPSETKRRKMKVSKFSAMLSARYADL